MKQGQSLTPAEKRELEALLRQTEQNNEAFKRRLVQLMEKQKGKADDTH
jgi:hypothetical protein